MSTILMVQSLTNDIKRKPSGRDESRFIECHEKWGKKFVNVKLITNNRKLKLCILTGSPRGPGSPLIPFFPLRPLKD